MDARDCTRHLILKQESFNASHAKDILELFDDEIEDGHSDTTAYHKATQDIDNVKAGEWDL